MKITPYLVPFALFASVVPAVAQEAAPPAPKQVTVRPGLTVTDQDAFAVYVEAKTDNDAGQFARIELWVAIPDVGFVRVTPCDDLAVACDPITVRAEGVNQGDGGALVWGE